MKVRFQWEHEAQSYYEAEGYGDQVIDIPLELLERLRRVEAEGKQVQKKIHALLKQQKKNSGQ